MIPLAMLSLALFSAPDLGQYHLEPWSQVLPGSDQIYFDSVSLSRSLDMYRVHRNTAGLLVGRDTSKAWMDNRGSCWSGVYWNYDSDTTHSTSQFWGVNSPGGVDSIADESFHRDTSVSWFHLSRRIVPNGKLSIMEYGPRGVSGRRIDTSFLWRDSLGRFIGDRTVYSDSVFWNNVTDSVYWSEDGSPHLWKYGYENRNGTRKEFHWVRWDGLHLVRDSIVTIYEPKSNSETSTISTQVYACRWDGPRFLSCPSVLDSSVKALVQWNAQGLPIARFSGSPGEQELWAWDSLGRMIRHRAWGTELDLDSMVYGPGPWPVRSFQSKCTYTASGDSCTLLGTVDQTYSLHGISAVAPRQPARSRMTVHGRSLVLEGLEDMVATVQVLDIKGRVVVMANPKQGRAEITLPAGPGLLVWNLLDASGFSVGAGRVVLAH